MRACCLFGLLLYPECDGGTFILNVSKLIPHVQKIVPLKNHVSLTHVPCVEELPREFQLDVYMKRQYGGRQCLVLKSINSYAV
jgi:hypothetical protein